MQKSGSEIRDWKYPEDYSRSVCVEKIVRHPCLCKRCWNHLLCLSMSYGYRQVLWGSTRSGNPQRNCVLIYMLSHPMVQWCSGCVTPFNTSSIISVSQELGLFSRVCKAQLGQGGQLWSSVYPHHSESSRCSQEVVWLQIQTWESEDIPR